jgi:hypothetical protein
MRRKLRPVLAALFVIALAGIARFSQHVPNVDVVGLVGSGAMVGACLVFFLLPSTRERRPGEAQ